MSEMGSHFDIRRVAANVGNFGVSRLRIPSRADSRARSSQQLAHRGFPTPILRTIHKCTPTQTRCRNAMFRRSRSVNCAAARSIPRNRWSPAGLSLYDAPNCATRTHRSRRPFTVRWIKRQHDRNYALKRLLTFAAALAPLTLSSKVQTASSSTVLIFIRRQMVAGSRALTAHCRIPTDPDRSRIALSANVASTSVALISPYF
jgi:hypothetical protein